MIPSDVNNRRIKRGHSAMKRPGHSVIFLSFNFGRVTLENRQFVSEVFRIFLSLACCLGPRKAAAHHLGITDYKTPLFSLMSVVDVITF